MGQSYQDWEMIIVDDCSRDHPEEVINDVAKGDARVRLIRLEKNKGAAEARNAALENAKGDLIAFLDGDDTWKPEKLSRQIRFMEEKDLAFSFTSYDLMNEEGRPLGKIIHAPEKMDYRRYLKNTVIGCLTVMIDKRKTGDFRMPVIRSSHDMALWLQIMKRGFHAFGMDEVLASYRVLNASNSSNKVKAAKDVWKVYREIEHLSISSSVYNFMGYAFHAILKRLN
jgi:teichuronic acid biosynthesis glycosyltransferase TuaG